jgi:arsenite/tail-anchored protein-transporting ATPase
MTDLAPGAADTPTDMLLRDPTRHIFLTGKGGVGKTSHACALSLALARQGRRVLLVSTDPASNLAQVLEAPVGPEPTPIPAAPGLHALNVDPAAATEAYRERALEPLRDSLPAEELRRVEEQLSGACTTEIATFDAFTGLLAGAGWAGDFDHVVFDTAPTGHTLRLLQLPAAWTGYLDRSPEGASCLGPSVGQGEQRTRFDAALAALKDRNATTLYLVARPDQGSLAEAARTSEEVARLGITHQRLIVNGVFTAADPNDELATALEAEGRHALEALPDPLVGLPRVQVPLSAENPMGLAALERFLEEAEGSTRHHPAAGPVAPLPAAEPPGAPLSTLVDEMAEGDAGLVLMMGKGGVGKTSLASAVAVELARRGHPVHLATTDPAAHLDGSLADEVGGLRVSRIDPEAETRRYRERVMRLRGNDLDEEARALLAEDLDSPCTEEVAVFHAFSRLVNEGRRGWVVLDTAPTGHTLLLLDTAGAYHREVLRTASPASGNVTTPLMRLQDPEHTRVLLATLAEPTPVEEARVLQADLRRAGIEPWAWIVNRSLAVARPRDPLLAHRAHHELPLIRTVEASLANRLAVVPQLAAVPRGVEGLRRLSDPADRQTLAEATS